MKISLVLLSLVGVAFIAFSLHSAWGDNTANAGQTPSSSGAPNYGGPGTASGGPGAAPGTQSDRIRGALAELNLTDAQRAQIMQIRATVTDRKERRQQVLALLTPDQRARLHELRAERRNGRHAAGAPSSAGPTSGAGTPSGSIAPSGAGTN